MRKVLVIIIIITLAQQQRQNDDQKCYGLAIQGGGDHGAWEVGALKTIIKHYPDGYDVISGVSIGAINGMFLSTFNKAQEKDAIQKLEQQWLNISARDVFEKPTLLNCIYNILFKSGILDNSQKEEEFLRGILKERQRIIRPITVVVTDATNGIKKAIDLDKVSNEDAVFWTTASTSIPAVFQSLILNETVYVDGGVIQNLDVGSCVRRCRELGFNNSQIVIDVLLASGKSLKGWNYKFLNVIEMVSRYLEIKNWKKSNDDLLHAKNNFPNVTFRGTYRPIKKLSTIPLHFNPEEIRQMIAQGEQEAESQIQGMDNIILNRIQ